MEALIAFITLYLKDFLILFGSSFATWFFVRKKQKAETSTVEIDNGQKIIELYQQSLTDLELRHKEQFDELKKMYEKQQEALEIEILKKAWCKDLKEFQEKWLKVKITRKVDEIKKENGDFEIKDNYEFGIIYPE